MTRIREIKCRKTHAQHCWLRNLSAIESCASRTEIIFMKGKSMRRANRTAMYEILRDKFSREGRRGREPKGMLWCLHSEIDSGAFSKFRLNIVCIRMYRVSNYFLPADLLLQARMIKCLKSLVVRARITFDVLARRLHPHRRRMTRCYCMRTGKLEDSLAAKLQGKTDDLLENDLYVVFFMITIQTICSMT